MKKYKVECTFEIEVELEDDANAEFVLEENSCPGTGVVGAALDKVIEETGEASHCWACALKGKNRIIDKE